MRIKEGGSLRSHLFWKDGERIFRFSLRKFVKYFLSFVKVGRISSCGKIDGRAGIIPCRMTRKSPATPPASTIGDMCPAWPHPISMPPPRGSISRCPPVRCIVARMFALSLALGASSDLSLIRVGLTRLHYEAQHTSSWTLWCHWWCQQSSNQRQFDQMQFSTSSSNCAFKKRLFKGYWRFLILGIHKKSSSVVPRILTNW